MTLRLGSMFSGIAGLDHGLALGLGCEPAWFCEADENCAAFLSARFGVPVFPDVRNILKEAGKPSRVDMICGGFP